MFLINPFLDFVCLLIGGRIVYLDSFKRVFWLDWSSACELIYCVWVLVFQIDYLGHIKRSFISVLSAYGLFIFNWREGSFIYSKVNWSRWAHWLCRLSKLFAWLDAWFVFLLQLLECSSTFLHLNFNGNSKLTR